MSKLITAVAATVFVLTAASGFAAQPGGYKKEDLTAEQKTEIRDRVDRMKAERTKTETTKPVEPAKTVPPKRTSKAIQHGKTTPHVAKAPSTPVPAVTTKAARPKA